MERRRHHRYFRSLRHEPRMEKTSAASADKSSSVADLHKMYMETKIKIVSH